MDIDKKDKIELLYKNLQHITQANYSAEATFPYWETLYALIIGQLIIAYFQAGKPTFTLFNIVGPRLLISIVGLVFSISWVVLVILNYIHSLYRYENIRELEKNLDLEYRTLKYGDNSEACDLKFLSEDITDDDRKIWLSGKKILDTFMYANPTSTWLYRKMLPILLTIIWLVLLYISLKDP